MDWKTGYRKNKGKLLLIGASALVLALIAFSGICLGTLHLCGVWGAASTWGFWEFFGGLSVAVITFLVVRPLSRRPASPATIPELDPFDTMEAAEMEVHAGEIAATSPPPLDPQEPARRGWRDLYDQLSREEQKAFKALMAKYVGGRDEGREVDSR